MARLTFRFNGRPWKSQDTFLGRVRRLSGAPPGRDFALQPEECNDPLSVKTTRYFEHVRKRADRATIRDEWIIRVMEHPEKTEVQSDGRIRRWARIAEAGKVLRVILLEDGETVHNAFFDRSFREGEQ